MWSTRAFEFRSPLEDKNIGSAATTTGQMFSFSELNPEVMPTNNRDALSGFLFDKDSFSSHGGTLTSSRRSALVIP
jgi:hypothetical protein